MSQKPFPECAILPGDAGLCWETFHENSKISKFDVPPSDHEVLETMKMLAESLSFHGYPIIVLPDPEMSLTIPLGEAILRRATAKQLNPAPVDLPTIATLLQSGYGITRDERGLGYPRAFRVTPSAGALYPLELYFHCAHAAGFQSGLYHYNPTENHLRLIRPGDQSYSIGQALVQKDVASQATLLIFITALFERSTFKYRDRGYRFTLLEAGHVAQNIDLAAVGLGLGSISVGGYYDRILDDFLDLDGLTHSTLYVIAIGTDAAAPVPASS